MTDKQKQIILAVVVVVVLAVLIVGGVVAFKNKKSNISSTKYDGFAQCLALKDFTMYGAAWCSHCKAQKEMFGDSFKYVKYVECPDNVEVCSAKGVEGYPTWITDKGEKLVGAQPLEKLAELSGCVLPAGN